MKVALRVIMVFAICALAACRSTRPLKTDGSAGAGASSGTGGGSGTGGESDGRGGAGAAGTTGAGAAGTTGAGAAGTTGAGGSVGVGGGGAGKGGSGAAGAGGGGGSSGGGSGGDGGRAEFCAGNTPRMVVNGVTTTPTVVGQEIALNCCRAARFVVTTSDFSQPIAFNWRWSGPGTFPVTIDLGNKTNGWSASLEAGCSVTRPSCLGALDTFTAVFAGELSVTTLDGGPGLDMSLCLHFAEPAGMPGGILHTLDLYAPHVLTRN